MGTIPEAHGEQIVVVGTYYLNEKTNLAEVAFVVRDGWQNKGLGTFVFKHLVKIAKRNGIAGFTAEVLRENERMQAVFNHSGLKVKCRSRRRSVQFCDGFLSVPVYRVSDSDHFLVIARKMSHTVNRSNPKE